MTEQPHALERTGLASSSTSVDANEPGPSSLRPSPSPSITSQSDDPDRDEDEDDVEDEHDFTEAGPSHLSLKERRNTLKARGSAALVPTANSSVMWNITPATAQNASAATLPHEILLHIFKYVALEPISLRSSLRVCKAWCLCGVELLWHRPSVSRISSLFKLLHIIGRPDQTFPYASFVRRLNLTSLCNDLEDSLFSRLAVCTRLERLTLTGCLQVSDDKIAEVLRNCKHLVAVDFSEVTQLTDHSVTTIAQNCHRLQGINLTGCKKITSASVIALARNCKLMRRVKLCGCELITDEALIALCEHCPVILEIDLINCPLITDASVRKIWHYSFHMRELRLAQCGKLTDLAFPAPASTLGGSSVLQGPIGAPESAPTSRGGSPAGLQMPLQHDRESRQDAFPTSSTLSDAPIYGHLRAGRLFDHLRILDLTNCSTISDASIEGIVACVPRLRNLILAKCTRLTNESAYSIARLGKNLHYLHLGHVSNLTDRAVCHLARSCTRLRYIDLACCPQLTDLSVIELAANLPKLRRIGLVRVTNLTDQAIYSLVERYTSLERIHLSYCENITVPAIFWLLERLSRLTHLSLTGVPDFRHPDLQRMRREPPKEFNAHQRAAFCVYSGKGVHELRKFLQKAYSSNKPPFRELRPEIQAYWRQATEQYARRAPRQTVEVNPQALGYHRDDALSGATGQRYSFVQGAPLQSSFREPGDTVNEARPMQMPQMQMSQDDSRLYRLLEDHHNGGSGSSMLATSAPSASRVSFAPQRPPLTEFVLPSGRSSTSITGPGGVIAPSAPLENILYSNITPQERIRLTGFAYTGDDIAAYHRQSYGNANDAQPSANTIAALATPPAGSSYDDAQARLQDAHTRAPGFNWQARTRSGSAAHPSLVPHDSAPLGARQRPAQQMDAHGDEIFANAEESLDSEPHTPAGAAPQG